MSTSLNKACNLVIISQCMKLLLIDCWFCLLSLPQPPTLVSQHTTGTQRIEASKARAVLTNCGTVQSCPPNVQTIAKVCVSECGPAVIFSREQGALQWHRQNNQLKPLGLFYCLQMGHVGKARAGSSIQISISLGCCTATFLNWLWRIEAKNNPFFHPLLLHFWHPVREMSGWNLELVVFRICASPVTWNKDFCLSFFITVNSLDIVNDC